MLEQHSTSIFALFFKNYSEQNFPLVQNLSMLKIFLEFKIPILSLRVGFCTSNRILKEVQKRKIHWIGILIQVSSDNKFILNLFHVSYQNIIGTFSKKLGYSVLFIYLKFREKKLRD